MVIMHGQHDNAPHTPSPDEIAGALHAVNARQVAPGAWTALLSNGATVLITDRSSVDVYETVGAIADHLDENDGAGTAALAARLMRVTEANGRAVTAWLAASGASETFTQADVCRELADTALAALVAIESLTGDPAGELTAAAARALTRIGGAR